MADVVEFIFERVGGLTPEQRRQSLTEAHGDVAQAMRENAAAMDKLVSEGLLGPLKMSASS